MYTLYLRLATPGLIGPSAFKSPTSSSSSDYATTQTTQIVLATYDGWNTCMDAPRWTTLASNSNSKIVFWESREKVAEVLGFVAGEQEQVGGW